MFVFKFEYLYGEDVGIIDIFIEEDRIDWACSKLWEMLEYKYHLGAGTPNKARIIDKSEVK